MEKIIQAIESERLKQGIRKQDLCKDAGISVQSYYKYTTGKASITYATAERVMAVLGYQLTISLRL